MTNELTDVRCPCGTEFPAESYDAGFIAGSGMCQNCDAALPPKDICTCPSGDGSLRHPCPAHPAVEQAGGDERVIGWRERILAAHPNSDPGFWPDALLVEHMAAEIADLRAALAQPSQAPTEGFTHFPELLESVQQMDAMLKANSAQAEAERPVVVAHVVHSNPVVLDQCAQLNANDEMMTVAQHTASVARWAEMFNRVEQERDAALAEVERLRESKGDPSGSFDRCMKMMYERDENAKRLDAALARVAELTATRNRYGVDAHYFNKNLQRILRDFESFTPDELARSLIILAKVADEKVVAQAQQLHDMDKQCRDDVARALGLRPSQERGFAWSYLLASIKSCVKAAEAQHSVPEGWMLVECGIWTQEQVDEMQRTVARFRSSEFVDDRALAMAVADAGQCKAPEISLAELLAAAPVCRLSRSALTEAQMRRLYENSTETENERLGFEAFARLIRRAEAVHQITAAPGKEGV